MTLSSGPSPEFPGRSRSSPSLRPAREPAHQRLSATVHGAGGGQSGGQRLCQQHAGVPTRRQRHTQTRWAHSRILEAAEFEWLMCVCVCVHPGSEVSFMLSVQQLERYPVDLYYLVDVSASMQENLDHVRV